MRSFPRIDIGDRVTWTDLDRGIIVAHSPSPSYPGPAVTVACYRNGRFTGHLTNIPVALLRPVDTLAA